MNTTKRPRRKKGVKVYEHILSPGKREVVTRQLGKVSPEGEQR